MDSKINKWITHILLVTTKMFQGSTMTCDFVETVKNIALFKVPNKIENAIDTNIFHFCQKYTS